MKWTTFGNYFEQDALEELFYLQSTYYDNSDNMSLRSLK